MPMVQIRHMRVLVYQCRVRVMMTVSALRHGLMRVIVVSIIVHMGMLMLQGLMRVLVVVGLNQMQDHPGQHEHHPRWPACQKWHPA